MTQQPSAASPRAPFAHGAAEGKRVVDLLRTLAANGACGCGGSGRSGRVTFGQVTFGLCEQQRRQFWERLPGFKPPGWMNGLISTLLPDRYVDAGVLKMDHFRQTLRLDDQAAPMCNGPWHEWGLTAFGWWSGEGDGDPWLFDLRGGTVGSMDMPSGNAVSYEHQMRTAYATFDDPADWRRFLVAEASRREWIDATETARLIR